MILKFKGINGTERKGCSACGRKVTKTKIKTMETFYLLSGGHKTFRIGKVEEVSDRDGEFLIKNFDCFEVISNE